MTMAQRKEIQEASTTMVRRSEVAAVHLISSSQALVARGKKGRRAAA